MKYLITESQYKLISELERHWMDKEREGEYDEIKDGLISYFVNEVESYGENDSEVVLFDSDNNILISYNKKTNELYYNFDSFQYYDSLFPHPLWARHHKYILSDVFENLFPHYKVTRVRGAHIS